MASGSTLINGALKVMAWTKIKTAAVVSVALLAVGGITTMVAKKITRARQEARRALVQQEIRQAEVQAERPAGEVALGRVAGGKKGGG